MNIDIERLKKNIIKIGSIGRDDTGGISRLAFSEEYNKAAEELKRLFEDNGLKTKIDPIGNVIGSREGDKDLPSIMIGSHLDTVKNGGLYDGALGIFAGLECISTLNDKDIKTNHPIKLVAFNAEEGSEMGGTFGSRVFIGTQYLKEEKLENKLTNYGLSMNDLKESTINSEDVKLFLELHIEQGGYLEQNNIKIGVVNGIAGITRYSINIKGEANHAGTTPMDLRKDALTMAADLLLKIDHISKSIGSPFVSTVGQLSIKPGAVNVIPGEVEFVLEMRDMDRKNIDYLMDEIIKYTNTMDEFQFKFDLLIDKPNVNTDPHITNVIAEICRNKRIEFDIMASGAGHDAKEMAAKVPIGMIFVPSIGGISHSPLEFTSWEDIENGTEVLLETILNLDDL